MEELVRAISRGDLQKVQNHLAVYPFLINEIDQNHCTPLLYGVLYHQYPCVEYLITNGANVNIQDKSGTTALMIAASKNYLDCLQLLLKSGALIEVRNASGKTALLYADENQHDECAKLLIDAGACLFTGESSEQITWMKASNSFVKNAVIEAQREWEKQQEIVSSLKKGIAQYALSNPSLIDIYNHIHRVCSHRIAATPRIPFPALTLPNSNSTTGLTSTHFSNAYYSLSLLSSAPAIQSILYRVLDIYCHKDLFVYPSKNAHIAAAKEKYRELNDKLRETIIKFEKEKEEERRGDAYSIPPRGGTGAGAGTGSGSLDSETGATSEGGIAALSFPPSHLIHCLPEDELSSLVLQRDEVRREIVYSLKDVLVPEKKYEAQRKYDYLERVIGLMKEWYTIMGGPTGTKSTPSKDPSTQSSSSSSKPSPQSVKRQSSYVSPTAVLSPPVSTVISTLNPIPFYDDSSSGGIKPSTLSTQSSLDDTKEIPFSHVPPIRDVFHALELFIQNLSVWYVVASQSPIQETNAALHRYELSVTEYLSHLSQFSTLQRAIGPHASHDHTSKNNQYLTDVTLEDPDDDSKIIEEKSELILLDPSTLLDNTCSAIHSLHTALDQEEYYWTRDPIATLYPSLYMDLQRILDYLTTLSLDIKKSLLAGFTSLKEKEKELQQVVLWIAGSPSYETSLEILENEVRLLKRDIIHYQREYEDKIHDYEKQRRKSGGLAPKGQFNDELKQVEYQLISSQVAYQYQTEQLNTLRKELCHLCYQTFPEISISNSSYFNMTSTDNSSSSSTSSIPSKSLGISAHSSSMTALSTPYPYPAIFSLPLLLSTHLNSSLHFLYQHAPLLSHGILQYHRSLEDYLSLTLVSSSESYLTYKAVDRNKEVYIKKYHITSSSSSSLSSTSSSSLSSSSSGSQNNHHAVVSVTEQSFSQFEKLYLEAARLTEISYSHRHPHSSSHTHSQGHDGEGSSHRTSNSFIEVQSLFISSPSSSTPSVYLVFPSYSNGNLIQFLVSYDAQLSLLSRVSLMKGLCSALSFLHNHLHILHCNLKLENILISSNYHCLLSDYDISYLSDTNRYLGTVHTPSKGFLDYLPPENLPPNSLSMTMASDIYCYGICLLRVLNKPLCRNRENNLHTVGYYDREDSKNGFKELIEKILSLEPTHRPSTGDILNSLYFKKWEENNWPTSENGESILTCEGGISRTDCEEIEKIKRVKMNKKSSFESDRDEDPHREDHNTATTTTAPSAAAAPAVAVNSRDNKQQPSRNVIQQIYYQRQRVCINCGFETDLSQGVSCCDDEHDPSSSSSATTTKSSHFLCISCLNQYVHSECSLDIASRRWLKIFDKTTKEEFHVRRSSENILPYFTTKKKCHVEGIDEILEKNPWSDLHEFNHEFDVRDIYQEDDQQSMMKIICPAYHLVTDLKLKNQRCEHFLKKESFLKLLTPQVLFEYERSDLELLEWKLTWEYSYRVTEERKYLLTQVITTRTKEIHERNIATREKESEEEEDEEEEEAEVEEEEDEEKGRDSVEEKIPEFVKMIGDYIEREIHCVRCPKCNSFVGNGKRIVKELNSKNNVDDDDDENNGSDDPVGDGKNKISSDVLPLIPNNSPTHSHHPHHHHNQPPPPPPPPPPRSGSFGPSMSSPATPSNTPIRSQRTSLPTPHSNLAVVTCPSCSNYFCSICLTDCGGLPTQRLKSRSRSITSTSQNIIPTDMTTPIDTTPHPYSDNEEIESLKRKKYFHSLTCPYNCYGRVWLTEEEFYKLHEDRIVSMTFDFLQLFPEEIQQEYLKYSTIKGSKDGKEFNDGGQEGEGYGRGQGQGQGQGQGESESKQGGGGGGGGGGGRGKGKGRGMKEIEI